MKKYILSTILVATAVLTSGCSDWFDVSPKTDIKAEELFTTENGFQSALAGLYVSLTTNEAYGGNLSFGMLDQMAQLYDYIPDGTNSRDAIYIYDVHTTSYDTKTKLEQSWLKAYNIIANCNNLMKWLERNGSEVIPNQQDRDNIRAEALAIRAYLHFDLLRGWGPIYKNDSTALSIPYRTVADASRQPLLPANEVAHKIINDLNESIRLLSYESNLNLATNKDRRFRFNYHAVEALMARVYCWIGDADNAVMHAQNVIANCGLSLQTSNNGDPILFNECICALNLYKMSDNVSSKFTEGPKFTTHYFISTQSLNTIFESTGTSSDVDFRAKSTAFIRYEAQQQAISRKYIDNANEAIPLIRLPEMYYILAQMSPLEEGAKYVNAVRNARGYSTSTNITEFFDELYRDDVMDAEVRKEFYAEGQYFYFLKQNEITWFYNCPPSFSVEKFVFPLPDAEKEYGWTANTTSKESEE